jgi:hypothetical protein
LSVGMLVFVGWLSGKLVERSRSRAEAILEEAKARLSAAQQEAVRATTARIKAEQEEAALRAKIFSDFFQSQARFQMRMEQMTLDYSAEWAKVLIKHAGAASRPSQVLNDRQVFDSVWREAVKRTHPDTNNGRGGDEFKKVMAARDRIKTLKGWQ